MASSELAPVLASELRQRRHGRGGAGSRHWHVDETYKVRGRWCCLYRATDRDGQLIDTMLSEHSDMAAAQAFVRSMLGHQHVPANRRRLLHLRRATAALAILEAA